MDTSELDGIGEAIRQREIQRDHALGLCRALARTEPHGEQERDFIDEIRQRFSNGEPPMPDRIPF